MHAGEIASAPALQSSHSYPIQYDYLLGGEEEVVGDAPPPIGYGSNGSAKLKNNFTLISPSIVSTPSSCVRGIVM